MLRLDGTVIVTPGKQLSVATWRVRDGVGDNVRRNKAPVKGVMWSATDNVVE